MIPNIDNLKSTGFLTITMFFQFLIVTLIFFDVPVARQVAGFVYFTTVPGFIIVKLLKLDRLERLEKVLLSIGLSVAFLMIAGLLINEFGYLLGFTKPLSFLPLTIALNIFVLVGAVLAHLRNRGSAPPERNAVELPWLAPLLIGLPVLSIVGAISVGFYNSNSILLCLMILISLLFMVTVFSNKVSTSKLCPLLIFAVAISLLYHSSLISNYIVHFGSDVPGEYFAFKIVENNALWSSTNPYPGDVSVGRTYAMLSVTILPSLYSTLLKLDPMWVFKLLNPSIFSLVPLGLYILWKKSVGSKYAFVSVFFFMSLQTFYTELLGLSKEMIAELFFVLLLLVVFNRRISPTGKAACFMIFSFALIVSHYALAEIFLFFISLALVSFIIMKRRSGNITTTMVVFFLVLMFFWYIYTSSSSVFDASLSFADHISKQLGDFFDLRSREPEVLRGLGLEAAPSIWNWISRAFAYLTEFLVLIGFISLIAKRAKIRLEEDYFVLTIVSVIFLAILILIPGLSGTMNITRFYHILLFFLAPLFVIGAEFTIDLVSKHENEFRTSVLVILVLVPYFLFQTGFIYEVTGSDSWSLPLSGYRMSAIRFYGQLGYPDEYSIYGAQWLSRNADVDNIQMYGDYFSRASILRSYGAVYIGNVEFLSNATKVMTGGIVYLNRLNVIDGNVMGRRYLWNTSELTFLGNLNKVYSNGGSEVYKNNP